MAVRGPDQRRQDESESTPALFFFGCIPVDASIAAPWIERHSNGRSSMQHDPIEAAQGGRPSQDYSPQGVGFTGRWVPVR